MMVVVAKLEMAVSQHPIQTILTLPEDVPVLLTVKGADGAVIKFCKSITWAQNEAKALSTEGFRTMAFAGLQLSQDLWNERGLQYSSYATGHDEIIQSVVTECGEWEVLAVSGVEDHLQIECRESISKLNQAGIKVWILTGDKCETAICVAQNAGLIWATSHVIQIPDEITDPLMFEEFLKRETDLHLIEDCVLVMDPRSYSACLRLKRHGELLLDMRSVVLSRLSPKDKAELTQYLTNMRDAKGGKKVTTLAIGDGGNDVPMLLEADVGVGLQGKEGSQASLSGDVSISQFRHLVPLILWHGQSAKERSSKLTTFIIHRGLIFAFIQALYCSLFVYVPLPIYQGWLCVGYATVFTMFPVFCLILGSSVNKADALSNPAHYRSSDSVTAYDLVFMWTRLSLLQAFTIMVMAIFLFDSNITHLVAITFTALISVELLNVLSECHRITWWMILSQLFSILMYIGTMKILPQYFDSENFVWHREFFLKVFVVTVFTWLPIHLLTHTK